MNELNGTTYLNVQRCDQFTFPPPQDIEEAKHLPTLNNKSNTVDYQVNNFDLSGSLFENGHQFWNSASGSCGIAMYNENGYHRVSNPFMFQWFILHSFKADFEFSKIAQMGIKRTQTKDNIYCVSILYVGL